MSKPSSYQRVTDLIIEKLESGTVPWQKPWTAPNLKPKSLATLKPYRGINVLLTGMQGYSSPYWLTYRQANELGGNIRKGEKATPITFFKILEKDKGEGQAPDKIPLLRIYPVFNVEQCENLKLSEHLIKPEPFSREFKPIDAAEKIAAGYKTCPKVLTNGGRACYNPFQDVIGMPKKESFHGDEEYYSTLFHEMAHSTGHKDRLNRESLNKIAGFGTHEYSKEELVAEMCSAFLCAQSGISAPVIENQAAYIKSWLKVLKNDSKFVIQAAAQAERASDYILGVKKPSKG